MVQPRRNAAAVVALAVLLRVASTLMDGLERLVCGGTCTHLAAAKNSVVVVLSYAVEVDGTPTAVLAARIAAGINLASRQRSPILFSGGSLPPFRPDCLSDAELMARHASRCHSAQVERVPRHWLEGRSPNTRENALLSLELLRVVHPRLTALHVVTSRFHARRACKAYEVGAAQVWSGDGRSPPRILCSPVLTPTSAAYDDAACKRPTSGSRRTALLMEVFWLCVREVGALVKYRYLGWM